MSEDDSCKTYSDEVFFGKSLPTLVSLDMVRGDLKDLKTTGAITVVYFFTTFYKGGYIVNEELTVLAQKFPDVQFIAISNDPEKEKVEKLLTKIADGTCCDPITKQVWRLNVPFVAHDAGKTVTKAFQDLQNVSVLHTPQAFIVDGTGKLVWRQALLQTLKISDTNFEKQLNLVKEGAAVEQPNGTKPKVAVEAEDAEEGADEMSLF